MALVLSFRSRNPHAGLITPILGCLARASLGGSLSVPCTAWLWHASVSSDRSAQAFPRPPRYRRSGREGQRPADCQIRPLPRARELPGPRPRTERGLDGLHVLRHMTGRTTSPAGSGRTAPGAMIGRRGGGDRPSGGPESRTIVDTYSVPLLPFRSRRAITSRPPARSSRVAASGSSRRRSSRSMS